MKTIMIYKNSLSPSGGVERVISNLTEEWCKNYNIVIVVKDFGECYYKLPSTVKVEHFNCPLELNMNNRLQRIFASFKSFFVYRKKLKECIKKYNPDYIYTSSPFTSLEVFLLFKGIRDKMVISEHGSYFAYNKVYKTVKQIIYPRAYAISVPNKTDANIYKKQGCNSIYIPHLLTFNNSTPNSLATKIFLNIGRMTSDKQQDKLLKMWAVIKEKKGWKLWIVGDGELKEKLKQQVKLLNLESSVEFINPTPHIEEIYIKASCFLFTSRMEGFGMVLLEAMSFGIPCVSFDCPSGPRDVIKNNINGYLIKNADEAEYVDVIKKIIDMPPDQIHSLGRGAIETIKKWDNQKIIKKWNKVFNQSR